MIDIEMAKKHLRIDGNDEDIIIQLYLNAAKTAASLYINRNIYNTEEEIGSDLDGIVVNEAIGTAILMQTAHLYENRESVSLVQGSSFPEMQLGYKYLLNPYRLEMGV
jgi:uncharacterized phage protein (predicted DNA packaging)